MNINTNIASIKTRNHMRITNSALEQAMERLSSGKRINTAADDAAGLAISSRMTSIVRGMEVAQRNAGDGISLMQTTEGAMGTVTDLLQRIRELAVQANNGTNSTSDILSLDLETQQLLDEIDHVSTMTEFNGVKVLNPASPTITLHISHLAADFITINLYDTRANGGTDTDMAALDGIDLTAAGGPAGAIGFVDAALEKLNAWRSEYGAMMNRMNYTIENLATTSTNTQASRSRVEDADMAAEVSNMTKEKILYQSSVSMLQHSNENPQMILQLLQGN
jgi:flagellin